jgi:elongation of very long chain fatty acids protein 7
MSFITLLLQYQVSFFDFSCSSEVNIDFYIVINLKLSLTGWIGSLFAPVGHGTMIVLLNSFIHIVMYSYYAITAMGMTRISKMMKKSLTTIQIIQFVIVVSHSFQLLFFDCDYKKWVAYYSGLYALMFFFLFMSFYIKSYMKKTKKQ